MRPAAFLYDLLAYLVPGAGLLLLTYWFFVGFFAVIFPLDLDGFFSTLIFFALAFFLGQLIQAIALAWEQWRKGRRQVAYIEQFLSDDDFRYTKQFKTALKKAINDTFGLTVDVRGSEATKRTRRQEVFHLCYFYILQNGEGRNAEIFQKTYVLLRGLVWVLWLSIGTALAIGVKQLVIWFYLDTGIYLPEDPFFYFDQLQALLAVGFLTLFVLGIIPLSLRVTEFEKKFIDVVYMNFFALYRRRKTEE